MSRQIGAELILGLAQHRQGLVSPGRSTGMIAASSKSTTSGIAAGRGMRRTLLHGPVRSAASPANGSDGFCSSVFRHLSFPTP